MKIAKTTTVCSGVFNFGFVAPVYFVYLLFTVNPLIKQKIRICVNKPLQENEIKRKHEYVHVIQSVDNWRAVARSDVNLMC